jgi:carbon-monoxide dehydrogenase medium subunit
MMTTELAPDEILTEIRVPVTKGWRTAYLKNAPRPCDFAIVGIAAAVKLNRGGICEDIAIGVTGISDKAYRPGLVEKALRGKTLAVETLEKAASKIAEGIDVNESIHASKDFRSRIARLYVVRAIVAATEGQN